MIKIGDIFEKRSNNGAQFESQAIVIGISGNKKQKIHMGNGDIQSPISLKPDKMGNGWRKVGTLVYELK